MGLIKKIILFIKNLFRKLFGKKKVVKRIKNSINNTKNKKYLKGYGAFLEDSISNSLPIYLMINDSDKKKLIEKVFRIQEELNDTSDKEFLLSTLNNIEKKIEESRISFYQNERISDYLDKLVANKELKIKTKEKILELDKDIREIIDNYDKNIQDKVVKEYEKVNYITISTVIIDETIEELKKLESDYKNHKFNKNYYDRELQKIKKRINDLMKLKDGIKVRDEIYLLKKDLYTKSKDKYDLLYNNEIFLNINNTCDDFLKKVNRKIIDLKKEKKEELKEEKKEKKEELEYYDNILKRFKDLELARKILLLNNQREIDLSDNLVLMKYLSKTYIDFLTGEKVVFNFSRNKTKTELVQLYNNLNRIEASLLNEDCIFIDHINFRMDELIEESMNKKMELENILEKKFNLKKEDDEDSILVNNKLTILKENEEKKTIDKVLVKTTDTKGLVR